MKETDWNVLRQFAKRARALDPAASIWAFGSRTRGTADAESDLDVCVVLEHLTPHIREKVSDIAWEVGFENEVLVSTTVFSREMFERGPFSVSPLVRTILREGVAV